MDPALNSFSALLLAVLGALVAGLIAALVTYLILWLVSLVVRLEEASRRKIAVIVGVLVFLISLLSRLQA